MSPQYQSILEPFGKASTEQVREAVQSATPQQAAILWLSIGEYEGAHPLCQDDASDLGSYLHGIVHRQEGDLSNAQYWFRRSAIRIEGIDPNRLSPDQLQKELVALMDLAK